MNLDQRYCESAAYHEAGHVVVGCVLEMPLREKGVCVDPLGSGIAYRWYRLPDGAKNVGSEVERERTVISTCAGLIAQQKFYPGCAESGAASDINLINALVAEMYPDGSQAFYDAKSALYAESRRLVNEHWSAIEALAKKLWAEPWTDQPTLSVERVWSESNKQRCIDGYEVARFLNERGVPAFVVKDSQGTYTPSSQTTSPLVHG